MHMNSRNLHFPSVCVFSASEKASGRGNAAAHIHFPLRLTVCELVRGCVGGAAPCVCVCSVCDSENTDWPLAAHLRLWPPPSPNSSHPSSPHGCTSLKRKEKKRKEKKRKEKAEWRKERAVIMVEMASRSRHEEDRVSEVCHNNRKKKTHLFKTNASRVTPAHFRLLATVEMFSSL